MHTCISSHGLKRSWRSCPRRVNAGNKNTPSTHHPRRRNVTTLMVGLKTVTYAKISPKSGEPQRYSWGTHTKNNNNNNNCNVPQGNILNCNLWRCPCFVFWNNNLYLRSHCQSSGMHSPSRCSLVLSVYCARLQCLELSLMNLWTL